MAIAAIGGTSRGTERGKKIAEARMRDQARLRLRQKEMETELAKQLITKFDNDGSGQIDKPEAKSMLLAYNENKEVKDQKPTDEDVDFLFRLCDQKEKGSENGDGKLNKDEVREVIAAWSEWLKQADTVKEVLKSNDGDNDGSISKEELSGVLEEVKPSDLKEVPPEVVTWVLKSSDLNNNGTLQTMELARALCAFEFWTNGKVTYPPPALAKYMVNAQADIKELPPAERSACCVVS